MKKNIVINGDCKDILKELPDNYVDSIVTDPPAGIGFMGKEWDDDKGGRDEWIKWLSEVMAEGLRVLKPGGHALVWALPRTSHWTGTALENAGFEVRDCVYHLFGSGFPKSLDISKAIDKQAGTLKITGKHPNPGKAGKANTRDGGAFAEEVYLSEPNSPEAKEWEGWGTALKPAVECWWLVRKPLSENTVAENVLKHGTGGLNIDGSRIGTDVVKTTAHKTLGDGIRYGKSKPFGESEERIGRFPANLTHDGSDVILAEFAKAGESKSVQNNRGLQYSGSFGGSVDTGPTPKEGTDTIRGHEDYGSPARFFYTAKPSSSEKNLLYGDFEEINIDYEGRTGQNNSEVRPDGTLRKPNIAKNFHPTVKAQSLMQYLIKLITPPKGIVLDMFAGSCSTLLAAKTLGHPYIGIELDEEYCKIGRARLAQGTLDF